MSFTKSLTSLLLLLQYLVINSLLFTPCLSFEYVAMETLSSEDKQLLLQLYELNQTKNGLISSNIYGKVFINPNDNTQEVLLQTTGSNQLGKMELTEMAQVFSDHDSKLGGNPRLAPTLHKNLCVKMKNLNVFFIFIFERFRGDLPAATADPRFNLSMSDFSARMEFYARMMLSFGEMAKLKMKHCLLTPQNFLYKENNANWDEEYLEGEGKLDYFSVMKNFRLAVDWETSCKGGSLEYGDPEEFLGEIRYFDTDKAKVEIYSMALIILFMETTYFEKQAVDFTEHEELVGKLNALSGHSQELAVHIGAESPFSTKTTGFVFQSIIKLNKALNEKTLNYSHDKLKSDLVFLISAMNIYYEVLLIKQGANANQVTNLKAQFKKFTDVLLTMVRKNNVNLNKRPATDEIIKKFIKIQTKSIVIESTIGTRRSLMLI